MTAQLTNAQTHELVRRVEAGERISVVGIDFGLLDTEVRQIVDRVRAARASRKRGTTTQPAPVAASPVARQESASPVASRVGRVLTTGSPAGGQSTVPEQRITDVAKYLEHPDKRIAKAAAAAHKSLEILSGLVFAWEAAETHRREQERARAEAAAEIEKLERQLAEARQKLASATGRKATVRKAVSVPAIPGAPTAAEIRLWAAEQGINVPSVGRVPNTVRTAYAEAHPQTPAGESAPGRAAGGQLSETAGAERSHDSPAGASPTTQEAS